MQEVTEVSFRKCRVGPVQKRYVDGQWVTVESDDQYGLIDPDTNRHSGDFKVGYASDTVLVFKARADQSHDDLKAVLETAGINLDHFSEIEVPAPEGEVAPALKSLPRSASMFDSYRKQLENAVERETDIRGGKNGCSAYLPVENDTETAQTPVEAE